MFYTGFCMFFTFSGRPRKSNRIKTLIKLPLECLYVFISESPSPAVAVAVAVARAFLVTRTTTDKGRNMHGASAPDYFTLQSAFLWGSSQFTVGSGHSMESRASYKVHCFLLLCYLGSSRLTWAAAILWKLVLIIKSIVFFWYYYLGSSKNISFHTFI